MKVKTQYVCQSCGYSSSKWLGRCSGCEAWNTLVEERTAPQSSREAALEAAGLHGTLLSSGRQPWVSLDVEEAEADGGEPSRGGKAQVRVSTGMLELDRVLG